MATEGMYIHWHLGVLWLRGGGGGGEVHRTYAAGNTSLSFLANIRRLFTEA